MDPRGEAATGRERSRLGSAVGIGYSLAVIAVAVSLLAPSATENIQGAVLVHALLTTVIAVAAAVVATRKHGLRQGLGDGKFGAWALLSFGLVFGVTAAAWIGPQEGNASLIRRESVVEALILVDLAILSCALLYVVGPPIAVHTLFARLVQVANPPPTTRLRLFNPWPLFFAGLLGRLGQVYTNSFGYLQDAASATSGGDSTLGGLVTVIADLGVCAVALAAYNHFRPHRVQAALTMPFMALVTIGIGLVSGNKEPVAIVAVALVLGYSVARRKFPLRLALAGALLFTFLLSPFITAYRLEIRTAGQSASIAAAMAALPDVIADQFNGSTTAESSRQTVQRRLRNIDSVAIVAQRTPEAVPYLPAIEIVTTPIVNFVPRFIWPSKPVLAAGYNFNQTYYNAPSRLFTSAAVTEPADLYRHGGLLVVLVGMGGLGLLYRALDDALRPDLDPRHLFPVVLLFGPLVKHEAAVAPLLAFLPFAFATAWLAGRLALLTTHRNPSTKAPTASPAIGSRP